MPVVGLDIHKRVIQAVVLDDDGQILHRERFASSREEIVRFAEKHLGPSVRVALEATTNTWRIVELLQPFAREVIVSNPMRTRVIAEAKVKTDKVDALILAQLLRADFLPRVWRPDPATQRRRHLTNRRAGLIADRTRIKNRIHAVLHQRLLEPPVAGLFGIKGMEWLRAVDLDVTGRTAVDSELRMLAQLDKEIAAVDEALALDGYDEPRVRLLMTLPGVDVAVAETLIAALGDIDRFRDGDHAASYLGLVPSTRQSADKCYHGPITKQGKGSARWMLTQAAQHVGTHPGPLGNFFRRLAAKKGRNVAVVATARKLVTIAWHMLKRNEPYRYASPHATDVKMSRHRVKVTGERRARGPAKGQARPPTRGTGQRTRRVPSLDELYQRARLPPIQPLSRGEERMLRDQGLLPYAEAARRPQRVAIAPASAAPSEPRVVDPEPSSAEQPAAPTARTRKARSRGARS